MPGSYPEALCKWNIKNNEETVHCIFEVLCVFYWFHRNNIHSIPNEITQVFEVSKNKRNMKILQDVLINQLSMFNIALPGIPLTVLYIIGRE